MRIFILFWIFLLGFSGFQAQVAFNRAYHDVNETVNPFVVNLNGNYFFMSTNIDAMNFGNIHLYKIDGLGNQIFRNPINLPTSPLMGFKSLDNKLVVAGGGLICDVNGPYQTNYIAKYDQYGQVAFYSSFSTNSGESPRVAVQLNDSDYFVFTNTEFLKFGKYGQLLFRVNSGFTNVSSAVVLPNNFVVLSATYNGANSLLALNPSGNIFSVVPCNDLMKQMAIYGGQNIMGIDMSGKLQKFSNTFHYIGQGGFAGGQEMVNRMVIARDTVYALASSTINPSIYGVCDTSFTLLHHVVNNVHYLNQGGICLSANNKVGIIMQGLSRYTSSFLIGESHYYCAMAVIPKFSAPNFTHDLALVDAVNDSIYSVCVGSTLGPTMCTVNLRAKLKVKNVGNTVVNSFKLNYYEYPDVACGANFYQEKFSSLSLNPGDSITVITNRFVQKAYIAPTGSMTQVPFCFYVTVPNAEVDKALPNNELCKSFQVLTTGISEQNIMMRELHISPNPFKEHISIVTKDMVVKYQLLDLIGNTIQEENIESNDFDISLGHLSAGMYVLRVLSKEGMVCKKIIKE